MQTPAGQECEHYYEDYHRGRELQECRCPQTADSLPWQPRDCEKCEVPKILLANSSENLHLSLTFKTGFLGFGRKVVVHAFCTRHKAPIENPYTGCPQCNRERPGLDLFARALEESDD